MPGLPVLKNVSFRVKSGETVALVGPTGSGKTSTMALVHRFYDVWEARCGSVAGIVGAHDFNMRLPQGYDTLLEQRASNLSLGQRQLISFARAIVADAKILVLDEATASIDSHTEKQIQTALERFLEGRTALVIAHRLATIRGADKIIVLRDGEIIETGDHHSLLEEGGLHAKLYSMNYSSFDDMGKDPEGRT